MIVHRNPGERAHRLTLAPGGDHADLFRLQSLQLAQVGHDAVRDAQVPKLLGDVHVGDHRAAVQQYLPPHLRGCVDSLLHAVDVAGESSDHDPAGALRKDSVEALAHQLSDSVKPSRSTLVESAMSARTPRRPYSEKVARSVSSPSTGVWSSLK